MDESHRMLRRQRAVRDEAEAPPPALRVDVWPEGDVVHVRPAGEIDLDTVSQVRDRMDELRAAGFKRLILDLPESRENIRDQHLAIVDAILAGDAETARRASEIHIDYVAASVDEARRASERELVSGLRKIQRDAAQNNGRKSGRTRG